MTPFNAKHLRVGLEKYSRQGDFDKSIACVCRHCSDLDGLCGATAIQKLFVSPTALGIELAFHLACDNSWRGQQIRVDPNGAIDDAQIAWRGFL